MPEEMMGTPAPEAQAAPAVEMPTEPTAPQVYTRDELKALFETSDSKTLKSKHPEIWEAVRPHIDREVTTVRKNIEAKAAQETQQKQEAQVWLSQWNALSPVDKAAAVEQDPRIGVALQRAKQIVGGGPTDPGSIVTQAVANGIKRLQEKFGDDIPTDAETVEELLEKAAEHVVGKERKKMKSEMEKEADVLVKGLLAKYHLGTEQPDKISQTSSGGKPIYTKQQIDGMSLEQYRKVAADIDLAAREGRIR